MSSLKQGEFEPEPINGTIPPIQVWNMAPNEASSDSFLLLNVYRVDPNVTTDCLAGFNHWNDHYPDSDGIDVTGKLLYSGTTLLQGNYFVLRNQLKYI